MDPDSPPVLLLEVGELLSPMDPDRYADSVFGAARRCSSPAE